ncbi:MAG: thrombospondin type 3 repeat-containing protein [Bdellovibrionota bacterium]
MKTQVVLRLSRSFAIAMCFLILGADAFALDFAATITRGSTAIGVDGNDDASQTQYGFTFPHISGIAATLQYIELDFSSLGTGDTFGVDLSNVQLSDVTVQETGGLNVNLTISSATIDNINKTLTLTFPGLVNLGILAGNLVVTVKDIQNPPIPFSSKALLIEVSYNGGATVQNGDGSVSYTVSSQSGDNDCAPRGFEIYYGTGSLTLDNDGNAGKDMLGLNPDVDNNMSVDYDSDGLSTWREFLAGTDPLVSNAGPTTTALLMDSDGDGIYDVDEYYAGAARDTDTDTISDHLDTDSDGDGILDSVEAGDSLLSTFPVDTDGDCIPDFQDTDSDNDGVLDSVDNCRLYANANQKDDNGNTLGDACEDSDSDGIVNAIDNCVNDANANQTDTDNDGSGDQCDLEDFLLFGSGCKIAKASLNAGSGPMESSKGFWLMMLALFSFGAFQKVRYFIKS